MLQQAAVAVVRPYDPAAEPAFVYHFGDTAVWHTEDRWFRGDSEKSDDEIDG